ncbi:fibroblast growth factor-binding protein 3 [Pholidichthys leucotaenia]
MEDGSRWHASRLRRSPSEQRADAVAGRFSESWDWGALTDEGPQPRLTVPATMSALPFYFVLLLLFFPLCVPNFAEAKKQPGQEKTEKPRQPAPSPPPVKRARNRSVHGSGEMTTKEGHRCTWQTSGEGVVSLLVNCSMEAKGGLQRYWCRYAGKPDLCPAYGVKSSQYWKQLVGKLKKRQNACEGEKVLKAKTCKKAPAEAHMKLATRSGTEEEERKRKGGKEGGRKEGGGRGGGRAKVEKGKTKKGEEEDEKKKERTGSEEEEEEGMMNDMEQNYCSEGWSSVCSFFVNFFHG